MLSLKHLKNKEKRVWLNKNLKPVNREINKSQPGQRLNKNLRMKKKKRLTIYWSLPMNLIMRSSWMILKSDKHWLL